MQDLDNCLPLDNSRTSSDCPRLNGNFAAIDFDLGAGLLQMAYVYIQYN